MNNWTDNESFLLEIPAPAKTASYSPILHSVFIEEVQEELSNRGLSIGHKRYLTAQQGQVMTGVYSILSDKDSEMAPAISFINSYNKTKKAQIYASGMVLICTNGMTAISNKSFYSRKHTGTALDDFREHIKLVVDNVEDEFERLVRNKEQMKTIEIDKNIIASLVGDMYVNEAIINSTQLSVLNKEIHFSTDFKEKTAWSFYNHCTESLKHTSAKDSIKEHLKLHTYMADKFQLEGASGLYKKGLVLPNTSLICS